MTWKFSRWGTDHGWHLLLCLEHLLRWALRRLCCRYGNRNSLRCARHFWCDTQNVPRPGRSSPQGVNKTHTPERHISHARALIFFLHSAGLCSTSSTARASNFKHCLRVKNGFCRHSGPANHSCDVNRALHKQSDGPQRAVLRRRQGHHYQLGNPVCALSHKEPFRRSCRTSLNYIGRFSSPEARLIARSTSAWT